MTKQKSDISDQKKLEFFQVVAQISTTMVAPLGR